MDFCRKLLCASTFFLLSGQALAHEPANRLGLMFGYNHSSHHQNKLHFGVNNTEIDSLHETGGASDFIGGFGYAHNILPWFVAYHDKNLQDSVLQSVWVGGDLLFMNTTQTGDVINGANSYFTYAFTEETTRFMINSQVNFLSPWKKIQPFVQASLGLARIVASYKDTPNYAPGLSGGGAQLSDEVNVNGVFSVGAGVNFLIDKNFGLRLGYLFTDFGQVETQTHSGETILSEPLSDHLYTSSVLLSLDYLF